LLPLDLFVRAVLTPSQLQGVDRFAEVDIRIKVHFHILYMNIVVFFCRQIQQHMSVVVLALVFAYHTTNTLLQMFSLLAISCFPHLHLRSLEVARLLKSTPFARLSPRASSRAPPSNLPLHHNHKLFKTFLRPIHFLPT
jgi:hypothetical protein